MIRKLRAKELVWRCPKSWLPRKDSTAVKPASTIVAQDRAVEAIAFGLAMRGIGFNVFVTGLSGTGRLTTIKSFVERLAESEEKPDDICFVFNFRKPEEPCTVFLEAGAGCRLKEGMDDLVDELSENLHRSSVTVNSGRGSSVRSNRCNVRSVSSSRPSKRR